MNRLLLFLALLPHLCLGSGPALTCWQVSLGCLFTLLGRQKSHLISAFVHGHVWGLVCDLGCSTYIFVFSYLVPPCSPSGKICLLGVEIRRRNSTNCRRFIVGKTRLQETPGMASDISQISQVLLWAQKFPGVTLPISLDSGLPNTFLCWAFVNVCGCLWRKWWRVALRIFFSAFTRLGYFVVVWQVRPFGTAIATELEICFSEVVREDGSIRQLNSGSGFLCNEEKRLAV